MEAHAGIPLPAIPGGGGGHFPLFKNHPLPPLSQKWPKSKYLGRKSKKKFRCLRHSLSTVSHFQPPQSSLEPKQASYFEKNQSVTPHPGGGVGHSIRNCLIVAGLGPRTEIHARWRPPSVPPPRAAPHRCAGAVTNRRSDAGKG